ncbi:flagellar motor protein MotB [Paenibacillus aurantius]|uniref:Flagellar motor protein MotB n=1 Tax=Paenibacillus aurantius TaxID=2918900 RepID=A0AA96LGM7_9BACL|nr:flagellar motor protein MotB [Paenibacillus aurantius]WNQ11626.1 flagellar motor protein MotB [Paenibacillus aurantius]
MARRSRKKHAEHENHERWLITYSDLITLLLIFFIIMYAMSKIDMAKYTVLAQSLNYQFTKTDSIMPQGGGSGQIGQIDPNRNKDSDDEVNKVKEQQEQDKTDKEEKDKKEKELQDLLKLVNQYIAENNLQTKVSAVDIPRGIAVTLNDLLLFDLGKADLKPEAYPVLERMASLFPTLNTKISIEGHTDNLPLATGSLYKDNWRLSSERSLSVLRYFTDTAKLSPSTFMSVAYADTRPVAENNSDANRQKNRRVEIVVLR